MACPDDELVAEQLVRTPAQLVLVLTNEPERLGGLALTE